MRKLEGWLVAAAAVAVVACKDDPKQAPNEAPTTPAAPVRVAFGDCAGPTTVFVSGPRPAPFSIDEVERRQAALRDPPPPRPDEGQTGGPDDDGTALPALDDIDRRLGDADGELESGFGDATGLGRGAGAGVGTIGTGRHGTIGHGDGGGSGPYGGRRRRTTTELQLGQHTVSGGDLDPVIVRRYVRREVPKLRACFDLQHHRTPLAQGAVVAELTIAGDGTVSSSKASGLHDVVAACVARAIRGITFPRPKDGAEVQVRFPLVFQPAEVDAAAGAAEPAADPDPPAPYQPGATNPLRAHERELRACFARPTAPRYAAAIVELTVGAGGAVTASAAHGIDDAGAAACVAEVARGARYPDAASATRRCAVAFGAMAIGDAPGIDITAAAVRYRGAELATVAAVVADADASRIAALSAAIADERDRLPGAVVAITGPRILRPVPTTPMKVVFAALATLRAEGADDGLAALRDGAWQVLQGPAELPVVPVPFGVGAAAAPRARLRIAAVPVDGERVVGSVLVTEDAVWIVQSRIGEQRQIRHVGGQPDGPAVEAALGELRGSALLADRRDLEIGADDAVTYDQVVEVIDRAVRAGFTDWQLMSRAELTTTPTF